jgi:hypothetical protein
MQNDSTSTWIDLRVTTIEASLVTDLTGSVHPDPGQTREVAPGVVIRVLSHQHRRGWGYPEVLNFALTWASTVSSGILVAWLADRLKGHKARLDIENRKVTSLDEKTIRDAIDKAVAKRLQELEAGNAQE